MGQKPIQVRADENPVLNAVRFNEEKNYKTKGRTARCPNYGIIQSGRGC